MMMIEKTNRLTEMLFNNSREEIFSNYILSDAIQFEFEKLYEDSTRLSFEIRIAYEKELHIDDLISIRNRANHNYESVSLNILIDTIEKDIPKLKEDLEKIVATLNK